MIEGESCAHTYRYTDTNRFISNLVLNCSMIIHILSILLEWFLNSALNSYLNKFQIICLKNIDLRNPLFQISWLLLLGACLAKDTVKKREGNRLFLFQSYCFQVISYKIDNNLEKWWSYVTLIWFFMYLLTVDGKKFKFN